MAPDRSHVHHRLIDMGFSQKQAVAILYVVSAILGLSAVVLTTSGALKAIAPAVRPVPGRGDLRQDFPQQPQRQPQRTHRATKGGRQPCP